MKTAKDIMTTKIRTIQSGDDLKTAMSLFLSNDFHFAPVVSSMGETLGLISELALVKAYLRHHLDPDKNEKINDHKDLIETATYVYEDASLDDVAKALIQSSDHRVLVQSPTTDKLVGIISPRDLLRLLAGEQRNRQSLREELEETKEQALKLAKVLQETLEYKKHYQNMVESSPNMMHGVDASGKIIVANKKIHDVLGYEPGELIGRDMTELYPKSVHHEAYAGLQKIMETGQHHTTYSSMVTKTGEKIRVDLISSALYRDGKFLHTLTVARVINSEILLRALHGAMD